MALYNEYTLECPAGQTYTNSYDIREAAADALGSTVKNRIIQLLYGPTGPSKHIEKITSEGTDAIIEEEIGSMLSTSKYHCERTFKAGTADSDIAEMEGYLESLNSLGWKYVKIA